MHFKIPKGEFTVRRVFHACLYACYKGKGIEEVLIAHNRETPIAKNPANRCYGQRCASMAHYVRYEHLEGYLFFFVP
jgi:hypothetical protein